MVTGQYILKKGFLHVNYVLKSVFQWKQLEDTHKSSGWGKALPMQTLKML